MVTAGLEEEVTALVGVVTDGDSGTFSSQGGKSASIAPYHGQGLTAINNVLTDLMEPHFSEVKIVPAGLPPCQEQQSRVSKVIQHGAQLQTGKEREK